MTKTIKIIVEKNEDGFIAYPIGINGVIIGQGDTYEEAMSDIKSAIKFHTETFGNTVMESEPKILEAFLTETGIEI